MGTKHDPTTAPVRRADHTLSGATRALLAPRLPAARPDHARGFCGCRSLSHIGLLRNHCLVHHGLVWLDAEHAIVQRNLASGLAARALDVNVHLYACPRLVLL